MKYFSSFNHRQIFLFISSSVAVAHTAESKSYTCVERLSNQTFIFNSGHRSFFQTCVQMIYKTIGHWTHKVNAFNLLYINYKCLRSCTCSVLNYESMRHWSEFFSYCAMSWVQNILGLSSESISTSGRNAASYFFHINTGAVKELFRVHD